MYAETNYAPYGNFHLLNGLDQPRCLNMSGVGIGSFRPVGNNDLTYPQLSFFDNPSIVVGREFDFSGARVLLPWTMSFSSYAFSGTQTWSVSSEPMVDGGSSPPAPAPSTGRPSPGGPWGHPQIGRASCRERV